MTRITTIIIEPFDTGFPDRKPWHRSEVEDTLETWQHIVDGYIEPVVIDPDFSGDAMFVNEEGKLRGLLVNGMATYLARGRIMPGDYIAGTVALIGPADKNGNNTQADLEHWEQVLAHLWAVHGLHATPGEPRLHTTNGPGEFRLEADDDAD